MKYVVTGGAGFIGSHISEALADRGEVVIIDNLATGRMENIRDLTGRDGVTLVQGSVTDLPLLRRHFEGAACIFHQAAIPSVQRSVENPIATHEANITGTLNVLVAARDAAVPKVVSASSSSVYGDTPVLPKREDMSPQPLSPYAVSKLAGEHYSRVFTSLYPAPATVSLRYFNVFGPRQDPASEYAAVVPKFITRILDGKPPLIYGDGNQTRDFTYVKDVVQANIRAMESDASGVYNIACGARISVNDLASKIARLMGVEIEPIHEPSRPGDVRDSLADISR
ncbi:MAG TPA: NAD-dependent epimerase/dehydratase family protein, partial [Methanomicrobiales archaeon]|nr:NAD-dependent epimerase/dehydratase family protein [Methanomicrobiales archaeon]